MSLTESQVWTTEPIIAHRYSPSERECAARYAELLRKPTHPLDKLMLDAGIPLESSKIKGDESGDEEDETADQACARFHAAEEVANEG